MLEKLFIKIFGDSKEAVGAFNKIKVAASKVGNGIKNAFKIGAAGVTAFIGGITGAVAAQRVQEQAINSLNQSLKQQGIFTKALSKEYQDNASALQEVTTFGDEAIIQAQSQLQAYLGQTKITKELTKSILDFAQAQGVDLNTAANLVGKSIGTTTNGLARYGVQIDTSASKAEKLAAVQEALNDKFGGQAEAAADGLGALQQTQNTIGDLAEVIGNAAAPVVIFLSKQLNNFTKELQNNQGLLNQFTNALLGLVKVGAFVKAAFVSLAQTLGVTIVTIVESLSAVAEGSFSRAADAIKLGFTEVKGIAENQTKQFNSDIEAINQLSRKTSEENEKAHQENLNDIRANPEGLEKEKAQTDERLAEKQRAQQLEQELEQNHRDQLQAIRDEDFARQEELALERRELENEQRQATFEEDMAKLNNELMSEEDVRRTFALQRRKREIAERNQRLKDEKQYGKTFATLNAALRNEDVQGAKNAASQLVALNQSKNDKLRAAGKIASLAQISISTAEGAIAAYKSLAGIPIVGPGLGIAAAGALTAYGLERAAQVRSAQQGGFVPGTGRGDRVPVLTEPGELIVPSPLAPTFAQEIANLQSGEGGGTARVELSLSDNLMDFIEVQNVERDNLGIAIRSS
jgi:hypothetical protein